MVWARLRLLLVVAWVAVKAAQRKLPPVVFVPGFAGSLLEANVDRGSAVNPMCSLTGTDHLWFNPEYFVPLLLDCWMEEMRLTLNVSKSMANASEIDDEPPGVRVHTINYGSIEGSLFDYGVYHQGTGIWTPAIAQLEKLGFETSNMFATPYDWRRGPGYWKQHDWPRLKEFIEEKVRATGVPAIVMAVSQGAPYFAGFLHHGVDDGWKKEHIASFFSFSGVFGGTVGGLALALWGDARALAVSRAAYDMKVDFASRRSIRDLLRGWGGVSMLLPHISSDSPFLQLPPSFEGNVSRKNLLEVLWRVSPEFGALYELSQKYPISSHPGVKTYCFFGSALPSPYKYVYLETPTNTSETGSILNKGLEAAASLRKGRRPDLMSLLGGISKLAEDFLESESNETAPTVPGGPPGSNQWIDSVAKLVAARQPDVLETTDGDGLVHKESLAICKGWTGADPDLDVEVYEVPGRRHGSDLFDAEALLAMRAAVAKVAGVPDSSDKSTPFGRKGQRDRDMLRPLEEFRKIVGPVAAKWDCHTWATLYFSDGQVHGCAADLILTSQNCDGGCREAFKGDPEFLSRRCPETCSGQPARDLGLDLEQPLGEFAAIVGPEVAAWTCAQWVDLYDAAPKFCSGKSILEAPKCDQGCRAAFEGDEAFMKRRCPETCHSNGTDLARPLKQFEKIVGPEVANWDCHKWVGVYNAPNCEADAILASRYCDDGCHEALAGDNFFVFRRCPDTCSSVGHAAEAAPNALGPLSEAQTKLPDVGRWTLPFRWILLLLVVPCVLVSRVFRRRARAGTEHGEANTPFHDGADYSEFEGYTTHGRQWWSWGSPRRSARASPAREVELQ